MNVSDLPSWGIVMTVDEPASVVLGNVAWHLETGAREVHVYLDRPGDPLFEVLAATPGCVVTQCDAQWWAKTGPKGARPASQMRRQSINANDAYARATVEWLLHLDADEFLWQHRPLARVLRHIGGFGGEVHVPVVERFYRASPPSGLFEGAFRRSTRGLTDFDAQLFGPDVALLNKGLLGHSQGKSMVPTGRNIEVGIHWSFRETRGPKNRLKQFQTNAITLLHFDGLTPLHFAVKVLRYAMHDRKLLDKIVSEHRRNQVAEILENCATLDEVLAFHDRLKVLSETAQERFADLGMVLEPPFDPSAAVAARFGKVDLSVAAFDTALRARYPEVFAFLEG